MTDCLLKAAIVTGKIKVVRERDSSYYSIA